MYRVIHLLILTLILTGCSNQKIDEDIKMMEEKISQFAKTNIHYDESLLDENQKVVLQKLYEASKVIDEIFLEQVYSKNYEIREKLMASDKKEDQLKLEYFNINFGPFDRLDHNKPFIGNESKPEGANFYPEDMTKEEFETFIKNNPDKEKEFTSEFTVIRRDNNGALNAIPYSQAYKDKLSKVSSLLREAAGYADNISLKKYLVTRAEAFETNDYFESDMAWMDLKDHLIEVVIGPYEVYEDGMFNYKASFESFVTLVDPASTEQVKVFSRYLNEMEENLPIPQEHKNFGRGSESPIVVVQEVFRAGDAKAGVQTIAFNLPNDERVRKAKGSKKVMIKNFHEAKFEKQLKPISEIIVEPSLLKYVTFDGFFNHTLMHEMSHGVGPGIIKINGEETTVSKELKETYSTLEECKADILGMYNNILMIEKGVYPDEFENELWVTFLGGVFRSVRFGINEAHGGGTAIIYNYLLENGGYVYNESSEKLSINSNRIYDVLKDLANKVLMIQATGNYEAAKQLIAQYAVLSPSMKTLIAKMVNIPVDINPQFEIDK